MLGKKVFFIKEFMKIDHIMKQVNFEDYLSLYTKDKLQAIINDEIHNDRNEEKELSGIHISIKYRDNQDMVDTQTLSRIQERIRYELRETDILVMWGSSELILLLPECSIESAQKIAFLHKSIIESKLYDNRNLELNYNLTYHKDSDDVKSFLKRLDLYVVA
jgi:GGDEF domain-containing protein